MILYYDIIMRYQNMLSKYDIEKWYHKMISYSIIIRWYHNIVLCSRNQAWEAGNFQIGGFSPYETIFTWNFQNRGFLGEPGVGNLRNIPPVALLSKNPYRQSLTGEYIYIYTYIDIYIYIYLFIYVCVRYLIQESHLFFPN